MQQWFRSQFSGDPGREIFTGNVAGRWKSKVPSLRNVALSLPCMHQGRFATLKKVPDHYAAGVKDSPTPDPLLILNGKPGIPLPGRKKEKSAFLLTITDTRFVSDRRFSNPAGSVTDR